MRNIEIDLNRKLFRNKMDISYLSVWISVIICLIYVYVRRKYNYWARNRVPFVEPKFPFGNLIVFKRTEHLSQRLATFYRQYKNDGPMTGLYFFLSPIILATDLDLIRNIFIRYVLHYSIFDGDFLKCILISVIFKQSIIGNQFRK